MAIANLVVRGRVGFAAGDVKYLMTHGLDSGEAPVITIPVHDPNTRFRPGYAPFTFPPKRFPPAYVKTR